ncbi:unnamed protein product [Caretta caretta]
MAVRIQGSCQSRFWRQYLSWTLSLVRLSWCAAASGGWWDHRAARNCFSPWTWSQYPPNPPKAASRTCQEEKGPLLHVFQGSQDLLLPRG